MSSTPRAGKRLYSPASPQFIGGKWIGVCLSYLNGERSRDFPYELAGEPGNWKVVIDVIAGSKKRDWDAEEKAAASAVQAAIGGWSQLG